MSAGLDIKDLFYCVQAFAHRIAQVEEDMKQGEGEGWLELYVFGLDTALEKVEALYEEAREGVVNFPPASELKNVDTFSIAPEVVLTERPETEE